MIHHVTKYSHEYFWYNYPYEAYFFMAHRQRAFATKNPRQIYLSDTVRSKQNRFSIVSDALLVHESKVISIDSIGP